MFVRARARESTCSTRFDASRKRANDRGLIASCDFLFA